MTSPPLFNCRFPSYAKEICNKHVNVYWYHSQFSQSRYPPGQEISEACTLICLLVAQRICQAGLLICSIENCPSFNILIAEAIVEGNSIHEWIVSQGLIPHPCLNTEEALKYGGRCLSILKEWFRVFHEKIQGLSHNIKTFLQDWYKGPKSKNLFMLLITCSRTVLFIFQEVTYKVTLFDSHSHGAIKNPNRGLVVAQTTIDKLDLLCKWFIEDIFYSFYTIKADQYELAFLYQQRPSHCTTKASLCKCETS
ncbi:uncharacterized protein [Prorops nasuta]|uniref:uncharacterized protein isoform X2 n=1 Tax=Prorops nasuta TaxID=863751 RepID=UPI0034CF35F1